MASSETALSVLGADWLGLCRRAAARAREAVSKFETYDERAAETGRGEGGDMALAIDRAAEDAIFAELELLGIGVTAVSEERGEVEIAGGGPVHVVIDPIDGSLNAKRNFAFHCVSIAVAGGPTMGDVQLGYVLDLPTGEEWWALQGQGAFLNGAPLPGIDSAASVEVLGVESANPRSLAPMAEALVETQARRIRCPGAIALTLCNVAAGRLDAMFSLSPCRSVDAAAGQLIVREAGGVVAFPDAGGDVHATSLDLEMRSRVFAAPGQSQLDHLVTTIVNAAR
jgi:myo-inositol-1(or 4)-monophosphatase